MRTHQYNPGYTVADYNMWDGDWELIDGYPYAMSPSATSRHQRIAGEIHYQIKNKLNTTNPNCKDCEVFYELDWIVNNNTVLRPDLAVVCSLSDKFITQKPALIVEILSPSTALKDRHTKFDIYQEQGVPYCIIIDPDTLQYNVHVLSDGTYVEQNQHTRFNIDSECSIELSIADIMASL